MQHLAHSYGLVLRPTLDRRPGVGPDFRHITLSSVNRNMAPADWFEPNSSNMDCYA